MEELRRTAAEYVLGTLDAGERTALRARMAAEVEPLALVRMWEARFTPLYELSASARPPAGLLDEILAALPKVEPEVVPPEPQADAGPAAAAEQSSSTSAVGGEGASEPASTEASDLRAEPAAADIPAEAAAEPSAEEGPPPDLPMPAASTVPVVVSVPDIPPVAEEGTSAKEDHAPSEEASAPPPPEKLAAPSAPPPPPVAAPEERFNPWRLTTGLLALMLLFGGTALIYRELHRPVVKAEAPPPAPPAPALPPTAPEPQADKGASFFAVLSTQPADGVALTLDPDAGEVAVLQLPAQAPDGMHYNLWVTSDVLGTRRLGVFRDASTIKSEELSSIGRAGLAGARLLLTLEPEGLEPPSPSGDAVFSGKAVAPPKN